MKNSIFVTAVAGVFLLICAGCHKETPTEKKVAAQKAETHASEAYLDWCTKTIVDPYQNAGHSNPNWDNAAKLALTEAARVNCGVATPDEDGYAIISNACVSAKDAGCDDPMIRYLFVRFAMSPTESGSNFTVAYCDAATALEGSSYPAARKFWAWARAESQVQYTYGYGTNIPQTYMDLSPWTHAKASFLDSLQDKTMPPEEVYQEAHNILEYWKTAPQHYDFLYGNVETNVNDARAKTAPLLLLKGEAYIVKAWAARGGGYANTVNQSQWKGFADDLGIARDALTKAWELDPSDARIPTMMLKVDLGQGNGRPEMEVWFNRAMQLNSNNFEACQNKLWYLEPKWYGSDEDMVAFGHECATNSAWGGDVPLIAVDAHQEVVDESTNLSFKANYWHRPEVWPDIKSAYERFFQENPGRTGLYHNYAWYAYKTEQWSAFNDLVPKLGPINYSYFGGKENFDQMVARAKEMAHAPPGKGNF